MKRDEQVVSTGREEGAYAVNSSKMKYNPRLKKGSINSKHTGNASGSHTPSLGFNVKDGDTDMTQIHQELIDATSDKRMIKYKKALKANENQVSDQQKLLQRLNHNFNIEYNR